MKKLCCFLLTAVLMIGAILPLGVNAEEDMTFAFALTVGGETTVEAEPGDVITVVLHLNRTDDDKSYPMYAMQAEIRYDSEYFELVEGSWELYTGVKKNHLSVGNGYREFYMNYLAFGSNTAWAPETRVGSFQLRVLDNAGTTVLTNEDYEVSTADGTDVYDATCNVLTVVIGGGDATGPAGSGDVSESTAVTDSEKEDSLLWLWILLPVLAVGGVALVILLRKKK